LLSLTELDEDVLDTASRNSSLDALDALDLPAVLLSFLDLCVLEVLATSCFERPLLLVLSPFACRDV